VGYSWLLGFGGETTMTQYYLLAALHHLAVFSLVGVLVAELVSVRPGLDAAGLRRLGILDAHYGALALVVLAVGFARVYFGLKGPDFYWSNPYFHAKLTAFILVGLMSITPTIRIAHWRRAAAKDPQALPDASAIAGVRSWLIAQIVVLAIVPVAAVGLGLGLGT
jgi:putative membrane protein